MAGGPEALEVFQSATPNAQLTALTDFLNDDLPTDLSHPQGYLIYVFFDEDLIVQETHSGILQVNDPGVLQTLQTLQLTMPSDGFFYTYLTNYSDQLVIFDNLTIRHKQGVLRAAYDYYPYGLPWDRVGSPYDETMAGTEFQSGEWGLEGLDLNYFAARYYDPILGRWHALDPLEQCHSPYLAMLGDPANFIDPDGRAGIPFLQDFMKHDGKEFLLTLAAQAAFLAGILAPASSIVGTIKSAVSIASALFSAASVPSLVSFVRGVYDPESKSELNSQNKKPNDNSSSYMQSNNSDLKRIENIYFVGTNTHKSLSAYEILKKCSSGRIMLRQLKKQDRTKVFVAVSANSLGDAEGNTRQIFVDQEIQYVKQEVIETLKELLESGEIEASDENRYFQVLMHSSNPEFVMVLTLFHELLYHVGNREMNVNISETSSGTNLQELADHVKNGIKHVYDGKTLSYAYSHDCLTMKFMLELMKYYSKFDDEVSNQAHRIIAKAILDTRVDQETWDKMPNEMTIEEFHKYTGK